MALHIPAEEFAGPHGPPALTKEQTALAREPSLAQPRPLSDHILRWSCCHFGLAVLRGRRQKDDRGLIPAVWLVGATSRTQQHPFSRVCHDAAKRGPTRRQPTADGGGHRQAADGPEGTPSKDFGASFTSREQADFAAVALISQIQHAAGFSEGSAGPSGGGRRPGLGRRSALNRVSVFSAVMLF